MTNQPSSEETDMVESAVRDDVPDAFDPKTMEERRERNLEALRRRYPSHAHALEIYEPTSELVFTDEGEPDVLFQGEHLYRGLGGKTFARKQLEEYWTRPERLLAPFVSGESFDRHTRVMGQKLVDRAEEADIAFDDSKLMKNSFFTFIQGIGLGFFIEDLIEDTQCRVLVISDLNYEFWYHSLSVFDWKGLLDQFEDDNRKILFNITHSSNQLVRGIQAAFRQFNPSGIDGSYFFTHYSSAVFTKALKEAFSDAIKIGLMGLGFFEDELSMIANTYKNLENGKARIFKKLKKRLPYPVFIIGNGPSIDQHWDFIRKNQDKALIFACGSALDPIVHNGIKPDVFFMLERDPKLLSDQQESSKIVDLSKILLVGASNLFPGVIDFHDEKILFFRAGISSRALFALSMEQSPTNSDPLVANAGLSFALHAGFSDIYLFGVDAGAKSADYHHSRDSQYTTRKIKYNMKFNETWRGNFGGEIVTSNILAWSRNALESAIASLGGGRHIYNCSDGSLIKGAIPRRFETLSFKEKIDKPEILTSLIKDFPVYTRDVFDEVWEKADLFNRLPEMRDEIIDTLEGDLYSYEFIQKIIAILKPVDVNDPVAMVYRGTVFNSLMVIYGSMRRVQSESDYEAYERIVRESFTEFMRELCDEATDWFGRLERDELDWSKGKVPE